MYGSSLEDGNGIFQRDYEKPEDHGGDLHNRELDNNGDEYSNLGRRLQTTGRAQGATNEVPKELAEEEPPETSPYCVNTRGEGDVAT